MKINQSVLIKRIQFVVTVRFDISISAPLISYIGASMRKYEQSMIRALEIAWCCWMLVWVDGFELTVKRIDVW